MIHSYLTIMFFRLTFVLFVIRAPIYAKIIFVRTDFVKHANQLKTAGRAADINL